MSELVPVILCGGVGSRLWPLSRASHPKQFADLGRGRSLFGDALERGRRISDSSLPLILTNERYLFLARDELLKHNQHGRIICEPETKNTAPAIALAALAIMEEKGGEEALMLVLPSDHVMENAELFSASVEKAKSAASKDYIVTFGIFPAYASTSFGYIHKGQTIEDGIYAVRSFKEKPKLEEAVRMCEDGGFFWNSGIFLMKPKLFLCELKRHSPEIYELCLQAWKNRIKAADHEMPSKEPFSSCPSISIDYAVMEKTSCGAIMPLDLSWNDLGSWEAFFKYIKKDTHGNAGMGNIVFEDCSHCQAYSQKKLVAALGVHDLNIIATQDAVLITKNDAGEKIKDLLRLLKSQNLYHYDHHPKAYAPWGTYEELAGDDNFRLGRLSINPGQCLHSPGCMQRAAHFIVISGKAEISIDKKRQIYSENQSAVIPAGSEYYIKNPETAQLELIEIRLGNIRDADCAGSGKAGNREEK